MRELEHWVTNRRWSIAEAVAEARCHYEELVNLLDPSDEGLAEAHAELVKVEALADRQMVHLS